MSKNQTSFDSERGREAGQKSKRGPSITNALIEYMEANKGKLDEGYIVKCIMKAAGKGNARIIQMLWDRLDGPVEQKMKHSLDIEEMKRCEQDLRQIFDRYGKNGEEDGGPEQQDSTDDGGDQGADGDGVIESGDQSED